MYSSDEDSFSSRFSALDELIQLIYQGASKFVVLSSVNDAGWTVHLGLTGPSGRWWKGLWTEKNAQQSIGNKSAKLDDEFAQDLANAFIEGQLYVGNWSLEKAEDIDLTVGSTARKAVSIPLKEMDQKDAIVYAATVFSEIASQAQERKCRLHPPAFQPPPFVNMSSIAPCLGAKRKASDHATYDDTVDGATDAPCPGMHSSRKDISTVKEPDSATPSATKPHSKVTRTQTRVREETESNVKGLAFQTNRFESRAANKNKTTGRPAKGASLANPSKKARKYQPLEFEDE